MTVAQLKKFLRLVDRDLNVVCKIGEDMYDFDSICVDKDEENLFLKLQLL